MAMVFRTTMRRRLAPGPHGREMQPHLRSKKGQADGSAPWVSEHTGLGCHMPCRPAQIHDTSGTHIYNMS